MTKLVGILNVTPDSFSDGGNYVSAEKAIEHAEALIDVGAEIIDVGAESTRPGAIPLIPEEEWQRLEPVLKVLCNPGVVVSLDSYHPETMQKGLELGVAWVNDVSGFTNPDMVEAVKGSKAKLVVMHNLSIPANPSVTLPQDKDVTEQVLAWGRERIVQLEQNGISKDRIRFDPGIGFGKTAAQSLELIKHAEKLHALGVELLFGHSRKSCFSLLTDSNAKNRDAETLAASLYLAEKKVQYLRVHEVEGHAKALKVWGYLQ